MKSRAQLHPQYITDENGNRVSVVLPVSEYEDLLEDIEALAIVAERRDEPTLSHEQLKEKLKRDGLIQD
jgi:PHD/YefM family antitoxin component YafN of YafNO toxin-antitoxin module